MLILIIKSYSSDCVEKEENYFGKYDWIIFDQEYTQEKQKKLNFSEKIALMLNKKKYFMDGITCIFPDSLKFIYEVNLLINL